VTAASVIRKETISSL